MSNPVGFWSYARSDDAHSDGHLSQLRTIVGKAIALQYGADITIWQDIQAIPPGADWANSIERTIGQTVFFMPIVSPRYLKSPNCLAEFRSFRQRMIDLGRDDLIFPILYVGVDQFSADETAFGADLDALRRHQWIDFRPLRHADVRSHEVWTWVDGLAENILKVAVAVSKAEHAAGIGSASGSSSGTGPARDAIAAAAEEGRQREAAAREAEKARQRDAAQAAQAAQARAAAETARQREAAARAAEEARRRETAQKPVEHLEHPEVLDAEAEPFAPATGRGTAVMPGYMAQRNVAPARGRRVGVLMVSAAGAVVVAGTLVAVFMRHETPQASSIAPASAPLATPPAPAVAAPVPAPSPSATRTPTPTPTPTPPTDNATARAPAPDLEGSVDQILDSGALIVAGKIVNLYGIRGEDGRPARAMQRYLQSEGNIVRCFAHDDAYQCFANGHDVAAHAVRLGWARIRDNSPAQYGAAQDEARRSRAGVWSK
ncbi:TIR domain-containing protein [Caballeronia sp. Lep1P3]|uniref:TIR domain-containing protein n=1 Tax=Caballeronia sp. Lep1P3 TaxID=2878150 RepID=UPI001FD60CF5|nr:TIR domain-containing protein [Caballeronia sp. Lep1P3]